VSKPRLTIDERPAVPTGYRRVADRLRQEILDGIVPPGSWVRMQAVADRLGTSVQPVREALQLLEGEGLVEILPNRGARVHGLDATRLLHIYEVREALESFSARRFAEDAPLAELRRLEAIQARHDAAVQAEDREAVSETNRLFHACINNFGANPLIIDPVSRYIDLGRMLVRRAGHEPGYLKRVVREHHAMLTAFRKRDATRAADLGAAHVRVTREVMLARLAAAAHGEAA
jgi:DNA-binding GntR family transcriptional regulator